MRKLFRTLSSLGLSSLTAMTTVSGLPGYGTQRQSGEYYPIEVSEGDIPSYSQYYAEYCGEMSHSSVTVKGADFVSAESDGISAGSYGNADDALIWDSPEGRVTYMADIPETGAYCLGISYFPLISGSPQIALSMTIDGETPFAAASRLELNRVWVSEEEIRIDSRGNQVCPAQVQEGMWLDCTLGDPDGLSGSPLIFYLEKGTHEIAFSSERADVVIDELRFFVPEALPDYEEYRDSFGETAAGSGKFVIEGEDAVYKSDPSVTPSSDNSSYILSPSDPVKVVYNTLGNGNWKKALQTVTWDIPTETVGEGGWYRIGIRAKQDQMRGFCSNRRIYIDGEVPCRELDKVSFPYDKDWNVTVPRTDSGEEVYVYLEGGRSHTFTMECVPGDIGEPLSRLEAAVDDLRRCYQDIIMITGPDPDKYTDHYVHEKLPELIPELERLSGEFRSIQSDIEDISGAYGSEAALLDTTAAILDKCVEKPLKIPSYVAQIKDNVTSVSAWIMEHRDQPLEVDLIEFAAADSDFTDCREKFWKSLVFGLRSFIGSFFEDYTTLSDVTDEDAIEVWVALGRDQAQIVREMTENDFMQKYDIPVSVNLVTGGIVEASLAGKGPDAALFLGGEFPVNLASRGLLVDVSQYPGFGEVEGRFQKNAMTQYRYDGGVYGIPISQSFPMMFYRTDILTDLGFASPPETWQELIDMLPSLQRNYMSAGLVLPSNNVSPATETGHTFALLMLQKGAGYYSSDLTSSALDSTEAVQSFEEWTDFYTKYSFDQTYDAFTRFRTGEYPIVIADYTFANQLTAASPEIGGLWNFCPVPGTVRDDGTISHAANSNGAGAVIFSKAANKEGAWEYIKWFTDTETQVRFGRQTEGLMGTLGRFNTANTQALSQLSWSADEVRRLTAQQSCLEEIPILPSSYGVTRNIMNAFRETVNEGENPRDTLIWYNRDINSEIEEKNNKLSNK